MESNNGTLVACIAALIVMVVCLWIGLVLLSIRIKELHDILTEYVDFKLVGIKNKINQLEFRPRPLSEADVNQRMKPAGEAVFFEGYEYVVPKYYDRVQQCWSLEVFGMNHRSLGRGTASKTFLYVPWFDSNA